MYLSSVCRNESVVGCGSVLEPTRLHVFPVAAWYRTPRGELCRFRFVRPHIAGSHQSEEFVRQSFSLLTPVVSVRDLVPKGGGLPQGFHAANGVACRGPEAVVEHTAAKLVSLAPAAGRLPLATHNGNWGIPLVPDRGRDEAKSFLMEGQARHVPSTSTRNTEYGRELSALRPTKAPSVKLLSTSRRQERAGNRGGRSFGGSHGGWLISPESDDCGKQFGSRGDPDGGGSPVAAAISGPQGRYEYVEQDPATSARIQVSPGAVISGARSTCSGTSAVGP